MITLPCATASPRRTRSPAPQAGSSPPPAGPPSSGGRPPASQARPLKTPQRPVVQKQQHEGQRHQHRLGHQPQGKKRRHPKITEQRKGPPHIADVGPEREHEKQPAEHVLPLGHPGHRFGPQGMDGKHGRHEGAGPQPAGHPPQHQKQEDRRRGVQHHVGQMVSPGLLQAVKLAVQHVGHAASADASWSRGCG